VAKLARTKEAKAPKEGVRLHPVEVKDGKTYIGARHIRLGRRRDKRDPRDKIARLPALPSVAEVRDGAWVDTGRARECCSGARAAVSSKRPPLLGGQTRRMPARTALKGRRSMVARKEDFPTVSDRRSTGPERGLGGRSILDGSPDLEGRRFPGDGGPSLAAFDHDPPAGPCLRGGRM
jgi:hypothetical protein